MKKLTSIRRPSMVAISCGVLAIAGHSAADARVLFVKQTAIGANNGLFTDNTSIAAGLRVGISF